MLEKCPFPDITSCDPRPLSPTSFCGDWPRTPSTGSGDGKQSRYIHWTDARVAGVKINVVYPGSGEFVPHRRRIQWDQECLPGSRACWWWRCEHLKSASPSFPTFIIQLCLLSFHFVNNVLFCFDTLLMCFWTITAILLSKSLLHARCLYFFVYLKVLFFCVPLFSLGYLSKTTCSRLGGTRTPCQWLKFGTFFIQLLSKLLLLHCMLEISSSVMDTKSSLVPLCNNSGYFLWCCLFQGWGQQGWRSTVLLPRGDPQVPLPTLQWRAHHQHRPVGL